MTRVRVFLAALLLAAGLAVGVAAEPAHAATWSVKCDARGATMVAGGFTGQTTAINYCIGYLDNHDSCWSGWVFWGTGGSGGANYTYKSRTKVSSWWCGNNTTPVNIRVWVAYQ